MAAYPAMDGTNVLMTPVRERQGTMQPPRCDVIGCRQAVVWRLRETLVGNFSEFLCDAHYKQLWETRPFLASHYRATTADQRMAQEASERESGKRPCRHLALIQAYAEQAPES